MDSRSLDGWLSKLATTRSGSAMWQRRWFVLTGDRLCYYNSPGDVSGDPKWALELGVGGASASMHPPGDGSDVARFDLRAGGELVHLKADSEVEAEMWLSALETPPAGGSAAHVAAPMAGGLFDGLAMPFMSQTPADPPSAALSAFGFMGELGSPPPASPLPSHALVSADPMQPPPGSSGGGGDAAAAVRKKKVVRKAKQPGGFGEDSGESIPSAAPPPPPPPMVSSAASPPSGIGGMFEGLDLGVPPPPPPLPSSAGPPSAHTLGLPGSASFVPGAPAAILSSGSSSSSGSSEEDMRSENRQSENSHSENRVSEHYPPTPPPRGSAAAYPPPHPDTQPRHLVYPRVSSSRSSSHSLSSDALGSGGAPHAHAAPSCLPAYASAAPATILLGGPAAERRKKSKSGDRHAGVPAGGPGGLPGMPAGGPPESMDVAVALSSARSHVSRLQSQHASLCSRQHDLLRRQAAQAAELSVLQSARAEARAAQAEASAAEDYERAAALGAQIGASEAREAALAAGMAEEEAAYQGAEEDKAELLRQMATLWEEMLEACRRCHSSRQSAANRESESRAARLADQSAAISAERQRLKEEAAALQAKEAQLAAKREEAQRSIEEEARAPIAERAHWQEQEETLHREIEALLKQVERKREQQSEASRRASDCSARIAAVEARFDKQLKKVEAKEQALAAAQQVHGRAAQGLEAAAAAYASELKSGDEDVRSRQGWVEAAHAAIGAAEEEISRQRATAAGAGRVAVAAAAVLEHRGVEKEKLGELEGEVAACERAGRGQTEAVVEKEAEAEVLARQLGAMQDQQVRLERDKRLAVAAQNFSAAARVASDMKALALKFEADTLARQRLLEEAETARSAQLAGQRRLSSLKSRLQSEQRSLDRRRMHLLAEHEEALAAALPTAETAQAELLRCQLASSQAARQALRVRWGWDEHGHSDQAELDQRAQGAGADLGNGEESDSESEGSDRPSPAALNGLGTNGPAAPPPAGLPSLLPPPEVSDAIHAALHDSDDSDSEDGDASGGAGSAVQAGAQAETDEVGETEPPVAEGLFANLQMGTPELARGGGTAAVREVTAVRGAGVAASSDASAVLAAPGEGTDAAAGGASRVPGPRPPPPPSGSGVEANPGDPSAAPSMIPDGGTPDAATGLPATGDAVAPVAGAGADIGGSVAEPGLESESKARSMGGSDRESLRRLLDSKEQAMQAAVDRDDFESASQLQEDIDLLTDRLEALG